MAIDGFPRIICSKRVGGDAGAEVHEGELPKGDDYRRLARGRGNSELRTWPSLPLTWTLSRRPPRRQSPQARPPWNPGPDRRSPACDAVCPGL